MTIYTHDEAALIVELFEDVLDRYNVKLPSPEDTERESDNEAKLYGSTYAELLDLVEERLIEIIDKARSRNYMGCEAYVFSGNV